MKIADYDFSRNVGEVLSVYLEMNGNDADLYLNDGTHFITVELKVAQSVVKVIHSITFTRRLIFSKWIETFVGIFSSLVITFYTMNISKR